MSRVPPYRYLNQYLEVEGVRPVVIAGLDLPDDCLRLDGVHAHAVLSPDHRNLLQSQGVETSQAGELLLRRPLNGDFFHASPVGMLEKFSPFVHLKLAGPRKINTGLGDFPHLGKGLHFWPIEADGENRRIRVIYLDRINQALSVDQTYIIVLQFRYQQK